MHSTSFLTNAAFGAFATFLWALVTCRFLSSSVTKYLMHRPNVHLNASLIWDSWNLCKCFCILLVEKAFSQNKQVTIRFALTAINSLNISFFWTAQWSWSTCADFSCSVRKTLAQLLPLRLHWTNWPACNLRMCPTIAPERTNARAHIKQFFGFLYTFCLLRSETPAWTSSWCFFSSFLLMKSNLQIRQLIFCVSAGDLLTSKSVVIAAGLLISTLHCQITSSKTCNCEFLGYKSEVRELNNNILLLTFLGENSNKFNLQIYCWAKNCLDLNVLIFLLILHKMWRHWVWIFKI